MSRPLRMLLSKFYDDYWHVSLPVSERFHSGVLGAYHLDLAAKAEGLLRSKGVMVDLRTAWPATLIQAALGFYELWLDTQNPEHRSEFLRLCDLLRSRSENRDGALVWPHISSLASYHLTPGWISALVQGQAASMFCLAFVLTEDLSYLVAARAAALYLLRDLSEGGLRTTYGGGFFYEEYPSSPPSHVLNGHIFACWGFYDLAVATQDTLFEDAWEEGINALERALPEFDTGYWSRYDLYQHPRGLVNVSSLFYHDLHISQLRALAKISSIKIFGEYASRWEAYREKKGCLERAMLAKLKWRLFSKGRKEKTG